MTFTRYRPPSFIIASLCAGLIVLAANRSNAQDTGSLHNPTDAPTRSQVDGRLPNREKLNNSIVTVITAPVGDAFPAMGSDMARVLDDGDNLRILPIIGRGSVQNLVDIMQLKGVDMAFVVADAVEFFRKEYEVPNIYKRVSYILKLYNNDVHIIARKEIKTVRDLAGKKIMAERNLGYFAIRNILDRLNVTADIDSKTDDALGLQKLLNGEVDAWVVSAAKVAPIARNIRNDGGKFHFVAIPYEAELQDLYLPSSFTSAEYPNLVPPGQYVDTVAAPVLLLAYNWPEGTERYARLAKFVDAMFSKIDRFHDSPRHPKWRDTALNTVVPGWQRFKAVDDWLAQHSVEAASASAEMRDEFEQLRTQKRISVNDDSDQKELLFRQFLNTEHKRPAAR
jgi:uncharacterized protein